MFNQFEKEEQEIEDSYAVGEMTQEQYGWCLRELRREYQAAAEEAAHEAYQNELNCWYY